MLRCAELLPEALRDEKSPTLMGYLHRVEEHIDAHLQFWTARKVVPFTPTERRSAKKPPAG